MTWTENLPILHILDHSLPLHSGYAFRSHNIMKCQVQRGWRPAAVTSPKHEESWKGSRSEFADIEGLRYHRTGSYPARLPGGAREIALMKALLARILQISRSVQPRILHAHSPVLNAIPALIAASRIGVPVVYEIRAFWEDAAVDHGTYSPGSWKYKLVRFLETWACRRCDQIAVLCNGIREDLAKRGIPEEKLTIIPNGVDATQFMPAQPDPDCLKRWGLKGKTTIGFIGSFYHYEGVDFLIETFARLSSGRDDLRLLLAGGGQIEENLKERARRLGVSESVVFTGRIPHEMVPKLYDLIHVLVYPRYSMRLTELVTPLKPLEGMAMGKPVVASDIGGHRELIRHGETGLLFPPGNMDSLMALLKELLSDPRRRDELARTGSEWVRSCRTWREATSPYAHMYERALRGSTSQGVRSIEAGSDSHVL